MKTAQPLHAPKLSPPARLPAKPKASVGTFKWLPVRGCSKEWEREGGDRHKDAHRDGKGEKNPLLLQIGGLESCKGETGLRKGSAQRSSRSQPLPDLLKVQQD